MAARGAYQPDCDLCDFADRQLGGFTVGIQQDQNIIFAWWPSYLLNFIGRQGDGMENPPTE